MTPMTTDDNEPADASADHELAQVAENRFRLVWRLAVSLAVAVVVIAVLGLSLLAVTKANRISKEVLGSCQFYRDLSQVPLPATPTKALLTILADARSAYLIGGCESVKGPLPAADPRVAVLMPRGER